LLEIPYYHTYRQGQDELSIVRDIIISDTIMARPPAKKNFVKRKPAFKRKPAGKKAFKKGSRRPLKSSLGDSFGNMVRNPGNGACSTSSFSHAKPASKQVKTMETVGAPNIGFQNAIFSVKANVGAQASGHGDIMPVSQLRTMASTVPSGSSTGRAPWRYVVQETLDTFHMTNGTGSTIEVDLYDIFPKRNIPVSQTYVPPGQTATPQNSYLLGSTPNSYWTQGARMSSQVAADASVSVENADFYNASPMDSVLFKTYYRVAKRTRIFLPQGASHKHTVLRHINQLVSTTECMTGDGSLTDLTKCTSHLLIVVRGEPVDGLTPDQDTKITTSGALLQIVQTARFKWTWVADQASTNYYANNLQGITVTKNLNPASGTAEFIDQLAGED